MLHRNLHYYYYYYYYSLLLLESMMMMFSLLALLSVLKFRKHQTRPFSAKWFFWITSASFNMGCAFSVKYLAIYSCWLCSLILLRDFWTRISNRGLGNVQLVKEFFVQGLVLSVIPAAIYTGSFYAHFTILTKAGVHDALMTSAFQVGLKINTPGFFANFRIC